MEKRLKVVFLSKTENAVELCYAAFRQCYFPGFVGDDLWKMAVDGEIPPEDQEGFIAEVLESGHESPVEHVSLTFAVDGISRACSHQIVRHRLASYSQQSQRYCGTGRDFDFVMPPAVAAIPEAKKRFLEFMDAAGDAYADIKAILDEAGRKRKSAEDARFCLPNAAETKIVMTMNVRNWRHFFRMRCCNRAQWEVRAMADRIRDLAREQLPVFFDHAGPSCEVTGFCPEAERFSCGKYPVVGGRR